MITILPPTRNRDKHGAGYYGASRGKRKHVGVDFVLEPNANICAFRSGTVTKLGYAYANDLSFRYIEIKDSRGYFSRYFYVDPCVSVGSEVNVGTVIGASQSLRQRYPGITPHLHYEVFRLTDGQKTYLNPFEYLAGDV